MLVRKEERCRWTHALCILPRVAWDMRPRGRQRVVCVLDIPLQTWPSYPHADGWKYTAIRCINMPKVVVRVGIECILRAAKGVFAVFPFSPDHV